MGAPTWPPSPQRSERSGAAVAPLWAGHWARWGPDMAPKPPTFGARRRSRGAPLGRALGEMGPRHGGPPSPQRSERPGAAVALLRAGHWARWGPDMAPKPP